jgi:hypothetical protein
MAKFLAFTYGKLHNQNQKDRLLPFYIEFQRHQFNKKGH